MIGNYNDMLREQLLDRRGQLNAAIVEFGANAGWRTCTRCFAR